VHLQLLNWNTSRARCQSDGGYLATILSQDENDFVLGLLGNAFPPQPNTDVRVSLGGTDGKTGTDTSGPGTYMWITGEPWGYTNWLMISSDTEPDGNCTGCGPDGGGLGCQCDHRLTIGPDGHWSDRWEGTPRAFVCEALAR
jgi:hypothetical protein